MAANDQNIGAVSVSITGDYSQLEQDFATTQSIAAEAGNQVAAAFTAGVQPAQSLDEQYQALFASGASLSDAMASIGVQSVPVSEDLNQVATSGGNAASGLNAAGQASTQTATSFEDFAASVGEFVRNPLKVAGDSAQSFIMALGPMGVAALAAGAGLIELGKAIVNLVLQEGAAAEATQNLSLRLNLTYEETKHLSEMAQVAGISIDVLQRVSMRLADALEGDSDAAKKTYAALREMGVVATDSGDAMLQLLEKLAEIPDATERISKAHEIMGRGATQLEPLLANYKALSTAVTELGGQLDHEMVERLTKADDAADLLNISWTHFKENLASTFAPAVTAGLEMLTRLLAGPPALTLDQQIEKVGQELQAMKAHAGEATVAVTSMMGGGFTNAGNTAAMVAQKQALLEHLEGLRDAAERSKEYNREIAESNAQAADIKAQLDAYNDKIHVVGRMTDGLAVLVEQEKLETAAHQSVIQETAAYNEANGTTLTALQFLSLRYAEAVANVHALGDAMPPLVRQMEVADIESTKLWKSSQGLQQQITDTADAALSDTSFGQMAAALKALGLAADDVGTKTRQAKVAAAEYVAANTEGMHEAATAWGVMESEVNRLAHEDLPAAIAAQERLTESMQRMGAPAGQIQASQEKTIDLMIQQKAQAAGLEGIYGQLMGSFKRAYDQLGHSIAASIIQGKSFGQIMHGIFQQIEQAILGTLISAILKMAETWVINAVIGKAASTSLAATQVADQTAIAYAATFASVLAALPWPFNIAAAPAIAAGEAAAVGGGAAAIMAGGAFETGGLVPHDMLAFVHGGEYINTAGEMARAATGGGGITLNFDGAHFHGVPSDDFVKRVMTKVVQQIRLPLGMKTNF